MLVNLTKNGYAKSFTSTFNRVFTTKLIFVQNLERVKMAEPEFMQMGKSFVGFYYPAFANDRAQLANVYTDQVFD